MPASPAQIAANQANSAHSTGPKTSGGKAKSRANSYKHGLTGSGIVMPEEDAAKVEELALGLREEFKSTGAAGAMLTREIATLSVRMNRSFQQETAALSVRVRKVMDEFQAPEGVDDETADKLRVEAGNIALFDPSKEACLARKYEAAARRGFYRALQDLRQIKKNSTKDPASEMAKETAAQLKSTLKELGSFFPEMATPAPARAQSAKAALKHLETPEAPWNLPASGVSFVPLAVGRRR